MFIEAKNVIFVHIPKTGGSSIKKTLRNNEPPNMSFSSGRILYSVEKAMQVYPDNWNQAFKFTVIRNPWERLVSKWAAKKKNLLNVYTDKWFSVFNDSPSDVEKQNIINQRLADANLLLDDNGCISIEWFNKEIHDTMEDFKLTTNFDEFLFGSNSDIPQVDRVLRFENLEMEWNNLVQEKGWNDLPSLSHINASSHNYYTSYYNDETKNIVQAWCPKMIAYFGYEF